ncbi:preprotein translocase subunit YajC [Thermohalobacter berrensis]|uniref:Preprotein translocase subunit YajC n=1 Tax=Thermohalobacter berrensis TaxID=99594 RepID=A0A419TAZ9_9FIRM|nr:preprotein translocase subunit YajC [Thermohalobacter berrensis]RKD34659.1 preprotein translocase subunit YajC [Thermohalobacter berrensis]
MQGFSGLLLPILFLVIFYFLLIRPQKKKQKQIEEMRQNLKVGDEVTTIGGIYGKITKLKDDIVTIEVGSDKNKFEIARWAIGSVRNNTETEE